jgi:hypothetical protein
MTENTAEEIRAVLAAYRNVKDASWPSLHPQMSARAKRWPEANEAELRSELDGYLAEASAPTCPVRVFWKLGPQFVFGGCNLHFATDAGLAAPAEIVGLDDFSPKLPWRAQADKYRADDKEVFQGAAKLDILERQTSAKGATVFVRVGKAPITTASGRAIGILGMYEVLEEKAAQKLFFERSRGGSGAKA